MAVLEEVVLHFEFVDLLLHAVGMGVFQLDIFLLSAASFLLILVEFSLERVQLRLRSILSSSNLIGVHRQTMIVRLAQTNAFDVGKKLIVEFA